MFRSFTLFAVLLIALPFSLQGQYAGFKCYTGQTLDENGALVPEPSFCDSYYSPPCLDPLDFAPTDSTTIKYIRVVLHFFQNTDSHNVPFPPGNFTNSTTHMDVVRSWFHHPTLGINSRLANICDPQPKVPGFESPHITDARIQFIFNGVENEDVFFYENKEWWAGGFSTDPDCEVDKEDFPQVVNGNTIIQDSPDLENAVHVYFPAAGASFDKNTDSIECVQYREGGHTGDFGRPGEGFTDVTGITLFGTYYRYIYDSEQVDVGLGFEEAHIYPDSNNIPYGGNGIYAEMLHILGIDHPTTNSHIEENCPINNGAYDRCADTPTFIDTTNVNIFMAGGGSGPGSLCGLTECQLGRAHSYAEINRPPFIRFAEDNFAYPTPWHDGTTCHVYDEDIIIDSSQVVNWDREERPNSNIVVKSGSILKVNCNLLMPDNGKIIVEPNAQLIVNGRITARCNYWAGVEVWGGSGSQYVVNGERAQGYVRILPGGVIAEAVTGVKLYGPTENEAGGILIATGATFENNAISVAYAPYQNFWPFSGDISDPDPRDYISTFTNCDFEVGRLPDHPVDFEAMVKMTGVNGIKFYGCNFNNVTNINQNFSDERYFGYGILALESGFTVAASCSDAGCTNYNRSSFRRFGYAIHASSAMNTFPVFVDRADFTLCHYGIYNSGISNATIVNNEFILNKRSEPNVSDSIPQVGIYLEDELAGITIQENTFIYKQPISTLPPPTPIGIYSREIGEFNNEIRRNTFEDLTFGNISLGDNAAPPGGIIDRGLTYLCNNNIGTETDFAVVNYPLPLSALTRIREGQGVQFTNPQTGNIDFRASGNQFSYLQTDFNNAGEPINYYYDDNGVNETPINTNGNVNGIDVEENACPTEYCAPPCMSGSELDDEKAAYYDARSDRNSSLARYATAENANDTVTMASRAREATYYQRMMDKASGTIVTHLLYDTLNFNQDTLDTWIGNLELGSAKVTLALKQQSQGNYPEATATLKDVKNEFEGMDRSELDNLSVLTDVLNNTSVYRLPLRSLGLLEDMADDVQSNTGNLARNILRSNGYYFAPIIQLPKTRAATTELSDVEVAKASSQFQLYPNPTNGLFTTYWNTDFTTNGVGQLFIRDATGRLVFQQEIRPFERRVHDLSGQKKGVYFYEVRSGQQQPIVGKIVLH